MCAVCRQTDVLERVDSLIHALKHLPLLAWQCLETVTQIFKSMTRFFYTRSAASEPRSKQAVEQHSNILQNETGQRHGPQRYQNDGTQSKKRTTNHHSLQDNKALTIGMFTTEWCVPIQRHTTDNLRRQSPVHMSVHCHYATHIVSLLYHPRKEEASKEKNVNHKSSIQLLPPRVSGRQIMDIALLHLGNE